MPNWVSAWSPRGYGLSCAGCGKGVLTALGGRRLLKILQYCPRPAPAPDSDPDCPSTRVAPCLPSVDVPVTTLRFTRAGCTYKYVCTMLCLFTACTLHGKLFHKKVYSDGNIWAHSHWSMRWGWTWCWKHWSWPSHKEIFLWTYFESSLAYVYSHVRICLPHTNLVCLSWKTVLIVRATFKLLMFAPTYIE